MRVLVNALSVTNQSGRHVLMGHLEQLRRWTEGQHEFLILHHQTNRDIVVQRPGFEWMECPDRTSGWLRRAIWETFHLDRIVQERGCDFIFTPAGVSVPGIKARQVVFCQNPWCLVPELHQSFSNKIKAWIQRRAYARTMNDAELMVFNSQYMLNAYEQNAGGKAIQSMVVYQAIAESTREAADKLGKSLMEEGHIVCVSAMGNHKGVETLVNALKLVRETGMDARLTLAGGWPDGAYRSKIEAEVARLDLREQVTFSGWVTDEELMVLYSKAHVFCLLSHCESFGIPAVEAQSFGTPALGTDVCAIPEIGGRGGLYSPCGDAQGAADHLLSVMGDAEKWKGLSRGAIDNSLRFQWSRCSRPLLQMFEIMERSSAAEAA